MEGDRSIMTPEEVLHASTRTPSVLCQLWASRSPVTTSQSIKVNDALNELQHDTGLDVPIHVDGASGAFLAPFTAPVCPGTFGWSA